MTLVQKEVQSVRMWIRQQLDYTKMRGPCPEGYHIPTGEEFSRLYIFGGSPHNLFPTASVGSQARPYFKLPPAGYRRYYDGGEVTTKGSRVYLRRCDGAVTSTTYGTDARMFADLYDGQVAYTAVGCATYGINIRPFKDVAVEPTGSGWTTLYDGSSVSAGLGIFWNQSLGIISFRGNTGYPWTTIADKNLGATTVYNTGDTLSQANCGNFYQWGNNYGFPFSGTLTTSTTRVDASSYGPGNYYSSSTYNASSGSTGYQYGWDSSNNKDLRGGVSGKEGLFEKILRQNANPVNQTFSYTGADQTWTVPYTQDYIITCKGAGSRSAAGGLAQGTFTLTAGDTLKIMVGQTGNSGNSATYGFGGSANGGSYAAGGGLSGVFTGSAAITATDSSRALIIGGGAGGSSAGTGGQGGGTTGGTGTGSYGTAGAGGTQTGRGSGGNAGANQFNGGNGSRTYGYGGGGGWRGGNGSIGDGSGDDDKGGGGGSGYVKSTATNVTLTTGGGSAAGYPGSVTIVSVNQ